MDDLGLVADWPRVCRAAYRSASALLAEVSDLEERIAKAQRHIESRFKTAERRLEARIAVLGQRSGDLEALALERGLYECLQKTVTEPRVQLDSLGAVFLSAGSPFQQVNGG